MVYIVVTLLIEVKDKLQRMLTEVYGTIQIDKYGNFVLKYKSTSLFVSLWEQEFRDKKRSFGARFRVPMVLSVPITPELTYFIAVEGSSYRFGNTVLRPDSDGKTGAIEFRHTLLANDLDVSEVDNTVKALLSICSHLDAELQTRFGGKLFGRDEE